MKKIMKGIMVSLFSLAMAIGLMISGFGVTSVLAESKQYTVADISNNSNNPTELSVGDKIECTSMFGSLLLNVIESKGDSNAITTVSIESMKTHEIQSEYTGSKTLTSEKWEAYYDYEKIYMWPAKAATTTTLLKDGTAVTGDIEITYGDTLTLTAQAKADETNVDGAVVAYYSDSECKNKLDAQPTAVGVYYVRAEYAGDDTYKASNSAAVKLTINKVKTWLDTWRETYSGVSLGTEITAAQLDEIYSGKLTTIKLGDYWTLNDTVYRVADYDYYYGQNDCTYHDLVLVPDTSLATMKMHSSDTNQYGYYGSAGRTTLQSTVKDALPNDIKNNLLTHSMYMSTATDSNNYTNTWELKESNGIELMSVAQVFGSDENISSAANNSNWKSRGYSSYSTDTQISLFKFTSAGTELTVSDYKAATADNIVKDYIWWLASTVRSSEFASVYDATNVSSGYSLTINSATSWYSVRPAITIKGACNHIYGEPSYEWASDNSKVTATRTCTKCQSSETEEGKITSEVTQQADCTKPELTTYTATFTNTAFSTQKKENVETKAALGHKLTKHAAVAATETTDGNVEYYTCDTCGKYFLDAEGKTETTKEKVVVKATGKKDDGSSNKNNNSSTNKNDKKTADTADHSNVPLYGGMTVLACMLAGIAIVLRKKFN